MKTKKLSIIVFVIVILVAAAFFINPYFGDKKIKSDFELDTLFLKIVVSKNETTFHNIKIKNINSHDEVFSLKVKGLEEFINLSADDFILKPNEEMNVKMTFSMSNDTDEGVYLGTLEVISNGTIKTIPIILEVQSVAVFFDGNINLYPQEDILPGQNLNANIRIYDLAAIGRNNIKLSYIVKSFDGRVIFSESEDLVIESKRDYSKTLNLPENIKLGNYVLIIIIDYEEFDSVGTSTLLFEVVKEEKQGLGSGSIILIIIMFGGFFLVFLGLFVYSLFSRDKLLKELKNQYKGELRRQREFIGSKERITVRKLKSPVEKREYKKEVKRVKRERLRIIKNIHKKRLHEIKEIKKGRGGKSKLHAQLRKWKAQGYNTSVLERKYKMPSVDDIRMKIKNWKKQGYDTKVLNKHFKR